jgi:hypothetical protein
MANAKLGESAADLSANPFLRPVRQPSGYGSNGFPGPEDRMVLSSILSK